MGSGAVVRAGVVLCVFATSLLGGCSDVALPPYLSPCHRNETDLNECIRQSVNMAVRSIKDGDSQLGIPPIDPLKLPFLEIDQGAGNVNLDVLFKNIRIRGLSMLEAISVKANLDDNKFEIITKAPYFVMEGTYAGEGQILILPVAGNGVCNVSMTDVTSVWMIYYNIVEVNAKSYIQVEKFGLDIMPADVKYSFSNLYDGDNMLGDAVNLFLNENAHEILNDFKPQLIESLGKLFGQLADQVFKNFPIDVLLPE